MAFIQPKYSQVQCQRFQNEKCFIFSIGLACSEQLLPCSIHEFPVQIVQSIVLFWNCQQIFKERLRAGSDIRSDLILHGLTSPEYQSMRYRGSLALRSVKPTSVESERCFSGLGRFLTKFRTRLSDRNLNCLLVLRHFFLNDK